MHRKILVLLVLVVAALESFGQKYNILGKIADSATQQPLIGVNLIFSKTRDTSQKVYSITDINGVFKVELDKGGYNMEARYIGYATTITNFRVQESGSVGTTFMAEATLNIKGAEVVRRLPPVQIKGDTTEYTADAFKTNPDANAEDLVRKMPGITVENGQVQAEGEDVKKVLVDGKEFFGDDPNLALKTLPAEMIDKVQVYDQASDQAAFTGVDDGNSSKTINIVTRPDKRKGAFGRAYAGYGTEDRYNTGVTLNVMQKNSRFTVLAMSNNINQQNFSIEDLFGVAGGSSRRGWRLPSEVTDFLVGPQNGVSTTHSLGFNYSGDWGKKLKLTGSYFFNTSETENKQFLSRTTFIEGDSNQFYNDTSISETQNFNHRFNIRLEYNIDTNNSIILTPKLSIQANNIKNTLNGLSQTQAEQALNSLLNNNGANIDGYNFSNDVLFRHRFAKRGRTLSVNIGTDFNNQDRDGYLFSLNQFYNSIVINDSIDQMNDYLNDGSSLSTRVTYTEAIGQKGLLQISYDGRQNLNKSDKYTYDFEQGTYSAVDTTLSNAFTNTYTTHRGGLDYTYSFKKGTDISVGVDYQHAILDVDQRFPSDNNLNRVFTNILPNVSIHYALSEKSNIRIRYRTRTSAPSASQLQNVVNNTNPVLLSTGNPNLQQEYNHFVFSRYRMAQPQKGRMFFFMLMGSATQNYISNSTTIALNDTTVNGIDMKKGTQLTMPVNLDGYWNVRGFVFYNVPLGFMKSNFGSRSGITYSRTPALINNQTNFSNTTNLSEHITIGSNISKNVDFTIGYSANYNIVNNTLLPELNNNYFFHTADARLTWIFWKNVVLRTDATQTLYSGLSNSFNQNYILWNASIGKKFLKGNAGELSLSVFDILNQNNSINRDVTQTYVEDTRTQVLNRYFMLTFTYTLRAFKKGNGDEGEDKEEMRRRYQHWQNHRRR